MRKSYVVCAVLLALSLLAGLTVASVIADPVDQVEVRLQAVDGDPAAADGLVVMVVHKYENLFWKSRIELGAQPTILSDFHLDKDTTLHNTDDGNSWLAQPLAEGDNWLAWEEESRQSDVLADKEMSLWENTLSQELCDEIVNELAENMGPNQTETFEVRLKDYADYYEEWVVDNSLRYRYYDDWWEATYARDLIHRPVEEDFCVAVTIGTDAQNKAASVYWDENYYYEAYGDQTEGDPRPIPFGFGGTWVQSQGAAEGTFVTLQMSRDMAPLAEESWFPHGYGLFYVPWSYEPFPAGSGYYLDGQFVAGEDMPQYDRMQLVLPLDRTTDYVEDMDATPNGNSVWVVTREGGEVWLTGFADGNTLLYRQLLPEELAEETGFVVSCRQDFFVVCGSSGNFAVYTLAADGTAQQQFTARNPYIDESGWHGYWRSASQLSEVDLAYRDGKLAVCGGESPWVQVYDKTGLLCTAEYPLSLNPFNNYGSGLRAYYHYFGGHESPVQLFWEK